VNRLADEIGATLSPTLPASEVVSFEALRDGTIAIDLANGTRTVILPDHRANAAIPSNILGAESFLRWMGRYAAIPIGVNPVGRKFFRRASIAADGGRCVRFAEAGRDV
jgi:hypothetical protein